MLTDLLHTYLGITFDKLNWSQNLKKKYETHLHYTRLVADKTKLDHRRRGCAFGKYSSVAQIGDFYYVLFLHCRIDHRVLVLFINIVWSSRKRKMRVWSK